MADAPRDSNRVTTLLGISTLNYITPTTVAVDPTIHALSVSDIIANSLVPSSYDSIVITYTDSTKSTIATVAFKLGATTISTLTPTFATLTNTWTKT